MPKKLEDAPFAKYVRSRRAQFDWTLSDVAGRMGVEHPAISVVEHGRRTPHLKSAKKWAYALRTTADHVVLMLLQQQAYLAGYDLYVNLTIYRG